MGTATTRDMPRTAPRETRSRDTVGAAWREARFAFRNAPAYRKLLLSAGIDPGGQTGEAAFRELPLTDKEFYRSNYPAGVVAGSQVAAHDRHVLKSHSSGTGGDRLTTVAYTYDLARRMSATTSVYPALKTTLLGLGSQRIARYAAPNCSDVECAVPNSTMESRMLRDGTLVLPVGHDLLATSEAQVTQAMEEIGGYRPDWFYTDATHFAFLIRQYLARGESLPRPAAVILTYTLATRVARRQIREALGDGVPIAEVVSMSELGWVAMECQLGRLHLNNSAFHVELLDRVALTPVSQGQIGELVVTSLGDRLLPHIRYRTGDLYRLMAPCACGHPAPAVRHEGRALHFLRSPDSRTVSPKELDDIVGADPQVIAYRMQQVSDRRFRFKFIPAPTAPTSAGDALGARLRSALGPQSLVDVQRVDYIPSERSGKFLSCVSDVAGTC
ncbi:phenylacetate--CoA ligase family protein [Plantactinospora sp. WMMB334]|uniref:phenylacetate--CoA ligase family protein n=1 Tax=Plantactinospora sp. WMMB334 TaxID=3404119 RepID=UPI003B95A173